MDINNYENNYPINMIDNNGNPHKVIIATFYYHSQVVTHLKSPNQI